MYDGKSIGVVIPVYNEAEFITDVLVTVPSFVDKIVVVDDNSTDETWSQILDYTDMAAQRDSHTTSRQSMTDGSGVLSPVADDFADSRLVPIRHAANRGRGAAVKTGYRFMLDTEIDVVAVMDGDGQMDPDVLDRIVAPVASGESDYAKGNRLQTREHCTEMSRFRLFGNVLLTLLTKIASGYWDIRDPQNGYTAISRSVLAELPIAELYDGYGFLNDLLIHLGAHGYTVTDVPIRAIYGDESSGIQYRTFVFKLSLLLLRRFIWRLSVPKSVNDESDSQGVEQ
jgi:glycosyltransferase involved in cell wall biosynthesis